MQPSPFYFGQTQSGYMPSHTSGMMTTSPTTPTMSFPSFSPQPPNMPPLMQQSAVHNLSQQLQPQPTPFAFQPNSPQLTNPFQQMGPYSNMMQSQPLPSSHSPNLRFQPSNLTHNFNMPIRTHNQMQLVSPPPPFVDQSQVMHFQMQQFTHQQQMQQLQLQQLQLQHQQQQHQMQQLLNTTTAISAPSSAGSSVSHTPNQYSAASSQASQGSDDANSTKSASVHPVRTPPINSINSKAKQIPVGTIIKKSSSQTVPAGTGSMKMPPEEVRGRESDNGESGEEDAGSDHDDDASFSEAEDEEAGGEMSDDDHSGKSSHGKSGGSGSRQRRSSRGALSVPADQTSIIVCGVAGDNPDERIYLEESAYFGETVDVYTALDDPEQRPVYRASALAHKFHVATNQVGMYLVRRRHQGYVNGLYQAAAFQSKPPGRTGLKAGGYFVSLQVCLEFEQYMAVHAKHARHRAKASKRLKQMEQSAKNQQQQNNVMATNGSATITTKSPTTRTRRDTSIMKETAGSTKPSSAQHTPTTSPKLRTSSVKVQSSQDLTAAPASLLYEFATVSMQSASTMQSAVSPVTSTNVVNSSTSTTENKKRKSMTAHSPTLTHMPTDTNTVRPMVDVYRRESTDIIPRQDEDMTDSCTSAATSNANSVAGTPTPTNHLRRLPIVPTRPKQGSLVGGLPQPIVTPSQQNSPYSVPRPGSSALGTLPSCPSSPFSLQSLSNSPTPQIDPSSTQHSQSPSNPNSPKQRVLPVSTYVKLIPTYGRVNSIDHGSSQQQRDETPSNEASPPPSKRQTLEKTSPTLPSVIPPQTVTVAPMELASLHIHSQPTTNSSNESTHMDVIPNTTN